MAGIALSGCAMYDKLFSGPPTLAMGQIRVLAEPDANRNSPVVLDVVLVADNMLEQRLMAPENKWFANGPALLASYPSVLQAYRCEFPPGIEMALPGKLFEDQKAWAVFVFASLADGERRARIEGWRRGGSISIAREGWRVAASEQGRPPPKPPPAMQCTSEA